jgi:hypothetical protein
MRAVTVTTWTKVEIEEDIEKLLDAFGGFHDGCLREVHIWTGTFVNSDLMMACPVDLDTHIRMLFQRQGKDPSAIELLFDQVVRFNLTPSAENYDSIIYDASLLFQENIIYWADTSGWTPNSDGRDEVTWIAAKALSWRDASEWMGGELRYGPDEAKG